MLKLYKTIDGVLHYWETWNLDKSSGIIYSGVVGQTGIDTTIKSGDFLNFKTFIQLEIDKKMDDGYEEFDEDSYVLLEIKLPLAEADHNKLLIKENIKNRLNETLGWRGLGHVDSESFESKCIKIYCVVVDFNIAKSVIERDLKNSEFSNYSAIKNCLD
jgi:hypothetical protein